MFIPMLDLLLAIIRRTRAGVSPFSPDKMHLHHRLLQIGHSHRRVVLVIYLWVGVLAFGAVGIVAARPQWWSCCDRRGPVVRARWSPPSHRSGITTVTGMQHRSASAGSVTLDYV